MIYVWYDILYFHIFYLWQLLLCTLWCAGWEIIFARMGDCVIINILATVHSSMGTLAQFISKVSPLLIQGLFFFAFLDFLSPYPWTEWIQESLIAACAGQRSTLALLRLEAFTDIGDTTRQLSMACLVLTFAGHARPKNKTHLRKISKTSTKESCMGWN